MLAPWLTCFFVIAALGYLSSSAVLTVDGDVVEFAVAAALHFAGAGAGVITILLVHTIMT